MDNATPTALPSAEDALRARERVMESVKAFEKAVRRHEFRTPRGPRSDKTYWLELGVEVENARLVVLAALQSPRASDEVLGEAGGQGGEVERLRALIKRIEGTLDNIAEGLSDEGGRVYLNSTEDADTIRALAADVTDTVHMILYEEPGDD